MRTKSELRKTKEWLYFYNLNKAEEHIYGKTKYKEYIDSLVLSKKIDHKKKKKQKKITSSFLF